MNVVLWVLQPPPGAGPSVCGTCRRVFGYEAEMLGQNWRKIAMPEVFDIAPGEQVSKQPAVSVGTVDAAEGKVVIIAGVIIVDIFFFFGGIEVGAWESPAKALLLC